jgi:hypothetical protein
MMETVTRFRHQEVVVSTQRIEHLEDSIEHVQGVLDTAQRALAVADAAQAKARSAAASVRRMVLVGAIAGGVLVLVLAVRRQR